MDEMTGNPAPDAEFEANPATETDDVVDTILAEEEPADEETPKDEEPKPRKLKVKIDGQELEVDEEEAARGYQRQADYSRHMQRLQAEAKQTEQLRGMYQQRLEQFIPEQVGKLERLNQELQALAIEDPAGWVVKKQEFDTELMRYQQAQAEHGQLQQEQEAQRQQLSQQRLQMAEKALYEAIPEWKDTATKQREGAAVVEYMQTKLGLGQEDIAAIHNGAFGHTPVVMARKAMLYDQLMQKVAARKSGQSEMTRAPAPVETVRSRGGASKDPDKMSTEEWMEWRNKQVRRK